MNGNSQAFSSVRWGCCHPTSCDKLFRLGAIFPLAHLSCLMSPESVCLRPNPGGWRYRIGATAYLSLRLAWIATDCSHCQLAENCWCMATVFSGQHIRRRRKNYLRETGSSNYFAGSFLLISQSSTSLRCRAASPSSRMLGILVTEVGFPKCLFLYSAPKFGSPAINIWFTQTFSNFSDQMQQLSNLSAKALWEGWRYQIRNWCSAD